jgi:hypothetical protein
MTWPILWTGQWRKKILGFLFQIRLRAVLGGCRNLLRTLARESGTGKEPRIRTVRQLAAAAGDGWLGSVGSPGQLETSLNSGYTVGPCNSYLEGPTLIFAPSDEVGCAFGDHEGWRVGMAADEPRHHRGVHHPQAVQAVQP